MAASPPGHVKELIWRPTFMGGVYRRDDIGPEHVRGGA